MDTVTFFIPWWLFFSVIVGWIADNKGRSGVGLFFVSLVISPLLGALIALSLRREDKFRGHEAYKPCPECAEYIKREAKVCRYCGHREKEKQE